MNTKRITLATMKSFVAKNSNKLYIKSKSSFDGMVDCVMPSADQSFTRAVAAEYKCENNLGIQGVWLVRGSRDSFRPYVSGAFTGIEVYNCCGSFVVAVKA